MAINEKTMKSEIDSLRNKSFKEIEKILRRYDYNEQDMIATFVASLCDVDVADMLSVTNNAQISQARWLYWFALRYYTHDTYQSISERTKMDGHAFASAGIGVCIGKMSDLIETDDVWKRRWVVTRRMIRLMSDPNDYQLNDFSYNSQKYKLMLTVPKGMKGNIEIELNEKEDIL